MAYTPLEADALPLLTTLPNGLRLLVTPMPYARSVSISIYLGAGSRYEATEAEAGLSHFLEHLCFKGTERRPRAIDISMEIDALGGNMNAATNRELTVYYAKVTPEFFDRSMDLLADMLRHSTLPPREIERERGVILEELAAVEDSPAEQAGLLLDAILWPGQPHGRDIAGTETSVTEMPQQAIIDYYRGQYVPDATVISIAGAVDADHAIALTQELFGDWERGNPLSLVPHRPELTGPRVRVLTKETEQAHLTIGMPGLTAYDEDREALSLLSLILGEGMSSRLFERLREELGLCYDIHSYMATLLDTGQFAVYAGVDPSNAVEAVREISRELARARQPVHADELERAKAVARSRTQLRMEDTRAVSALYGSQAILGLPLRTPEEALERSDAVTLEDLERISQAVIRNDRLQLAAVGPLREEDLAPVLDLV